MKDYLIEDYGFIDCSKYKSIENLLKTFEFRELFSCGQGYYEDSISLNVFVNDKYYEINVKAEIGSTWMDYGEKVYHVEFIDRKAIKYEEIEEDELPEPKIRQNYVITFLNLSKSEFNNLLHLLGKNKFNFEQQNNQ